ncbi:MAG: LysM peptidoglycan-binding domain-containing protein, partial [Bacteroidetes bacterium]|nr:LysM peptidoglycan-binding domain-containing protein [Bacteroidota bacterium]
MNLIKMKHFLLLLVLLQFTIGFAQPENAKIETINGRKHYVHFVQSGNTLYGIYKLYNVPVDEIVKANPGVEKGLQEGQRIIIPIGGSQSLEKNLVLHKVEAKETVYGIAKKYNSTPEELIQLNPSIENGLNVGQEIKIPVATPSGNGTTLKEEQRNFKVSFSDTVIFHEVKKGETLYSLSKRFMVTENELKKTNGLRNDKIKPGDVLKIP